MEGIKVTHRARLMVLTCACWIVSLLLACGDNPDPKPFAIYKGNIHPKQIECAHLLSKSISRKFKIQVTEKNREVMRRMNNANSFYINLDQEGSPIGSIGVLLEGRVLNVMIFEGGYQHKKEFLNFIIKELKLKCKTELKPSNSHNKY